MTSRIFYNFTKKDVIDGQEIPGIAFEKKSGAFSLLCSLSLLALVSIYFLEQAYQDYYFVACHLDIKSTTLLHVQSILKRYFVSSSCFHSTNCQIFSLLQRENEVAA
jgi:hypothetical protein